MAQLVARQRAERGGDPPPSSVLPSPPALRGPFTVEDSARGASNLEKSRSQPEAGPDDEDLAQGKRPPMRRSATGWTKLRQRIVGQKTTTPRLAKPFDGHKLTTELSLGTLPMVMLKVPCWKPRAATDGSRWVSSIATSTASAGSPSFSTSSVSRSPTQSIPRTTVTQCSASSSSTATD